MGPIHVANCSPRVGSVVDPVATKCAIHNVATLSTSPRGHVAPRVQTMWPTRQPRGPNPRGTLATVGNVVCNDVANCGHVYNATWLTVGHMSENHVADCGHVDHNHVSKTTWPIGFQTCGKLTLYHLPRGKMQFFSQEKKLKITIYKP
jgi:hypothetical protein